MTRVAVDATAIGTLPSGARTRLVYLFAAYHQRYPDPEPVLFVSTASGLADTLKTHGLEAIAVEPPSTAARLLNNSSTWRRRLGAVGAQLLHLETPPVPRDLDVPMVLELHDLRAFDDRWLRLSARGVYQRYLLPQSIKRVGRVVTPTNYGARVITARLGVEGETIQVVTGAAGRVDHAPRVEEVEDFRRRFGVDEPYILALGHLERRKNLGLLIDAVRLLDQTTGSTHRLVLVGDDHGIKDELRRRAAAAPAIDLTMTGRLAEPLKWAAIAGATCLVMPSLVEGFGIVSVEAMSVGCPVLAANAAAIPEVAGNAALLFNPTDAGDLCDRLQQFLADTELQARMVQLGYRRSAELTWEDAADQLHGVYSALAASGVR